MLVITITLHAVTPSRTAVVNRDGPLYIGGCHSLVNVFIIITHYYYIHQWHLICWRYAHLDRLIQSTRRRRLMDSADVPGDAPHAPLCPCSSFLLYFYLQYLTLPSNKSHLQHATNKTDIQLTDLSPQVPVASRLGLANVTLLCSHPAAAGQAISTLLTILE